MNEEYNTTKSMEEKYCISQTVSKEIARKAVKYITNFGEKVKNRWQFNSRETEFIRYYVAFSKKGGADEAFKRGMEIFFNIDCDRSN